MEEATQNNGAIKHYSIEELMTYGELMEREDWSEGGKHNLLKILETNQELCVWALSSYFHTWKNGLVYCCANDNFEDIYDAIHDDAPTLIINKIFFVRAYIDAFEKNGRDGLLAAIAGEATGKDMSPVEVQATAPGNEMSHAAPFPKETGADRVEGAATQGETALATDPAARNTLRAIKVWRDFLAKDYPPNRKNDAAKRCMLNLLDWITGEADYYTLQQKTNYQANSDLKRARERHYPRLRKDFTHLPELDVNTKLPP
jgi:hypothetical protein